MAIGWIVFALVFGSALLATFVRRALPEHHLSADSKDVVKLEIALVATMSALVLSLQIASAKSALDMRSNQLAQASADVILLNSALARYGPETKEARAMLQRWVADTVERFWPAEGTRP
jgi:heme/copper-type cytochrome/quinol oxidase subunit 3